MITAALLLLLAGQPAISQCECVVADYTVFMSGNIHDILSHCSKVALQRNVKIFTLRGCKALVES